MPRHDASPRWVAQQGDRQVVAIVVDDAAIRRSLRQGIERAGYVIEEFADRREFLERATIDAGVVCLDVSSGASALEAVEHLHAREPDISVVAVTGSHEVDIADRALRAGAYDTLTHNAEPSRIERTVRRAMERFDLRDTVRRLTSELDERHVLGSIVGRSASMREVGRQIERVLDTDVAVCIGGERGTGKDLVASAIHGSGRRRRGPFVVMHCAVIPETLHESELFGDDRPDFAGMAGSHRGRLEQANNGTIFLDAVDQLSPPAQTRLWRALQDRTIRHVGGSTDIPINVRVVCATDRDLAELAAEGRFHHDLYFRLMVYPMRLPALRERTEDVPLLVAHFIERSAADTGRGIRRIDPAAMDALRRYPWPGNVRELQNAVHRCVLATGSDTIDLASVPPEIASAALPVTRRTDVQWSAKPDGDEPVVTLRELERRAIERALGVTRGSVGKAARLLGIGRATLYRRLAELNLQGLGRGQAAE